MTCCKFHPLQATSLPRHAVTRIQIRSLPRSGDTRPGGFRPKFSKFLKKNAAACFNIFNLGSISQAGRRGF